MRAVLAGDLWAAARALRSLPAARRASACRRLLEEADAAHRYHRRFGRAHPRWGTGSIMARAGQAGPLPPAPPLSDPDWCDCLAVVLLELARFRRARQPEAQSTQRVAAGSRPSRPAGIASPQSSQ